MITLLVVWLVLSPIAAGLLWCAAAVQHPTETNKYWCRNCETYVHVDEMRRERKDDDFTTELVCPGCDLTLLEVLD